MGGWPQYPYRAHVAIDTQAGHKSRVWNLPLRAEVAAISSLKYTNHPFPPEALEIVLTSSHSFLAKYSLRCTIKYVENKQSLLR